MAKNNTKNSALRSSLKALGKLSKTIAGNTLQEMAPGIHSAVTSTADVARDVAMNSRDAILRTKTQVNEQIRAMKNTIAGKSAMQIINGAFSDIKDGSYSIDKLSDDSYDAIDDFDDIFDDSSKGVDMNDPSSVAMMESKRNTAILGKAVAQGNVASIEGMKQMTKTLSTVTIKAHEASTAKLTNIALIGINQTNAHLAGISSKLDAINNNLISMIDFQGQNIATVNQTAMDYYSNSSQWMSDMGEVLLGIKEYMEKSKENLRGRNNENNQFDFSNGFDANTYKELVKKNFQNSEIGAILGMGKMAYDLVAGAGSSMGMSTGDMIGSMINLSKFIPKNTKKSIQKFDKMFTNSIDDLLYTIGDWVNDSRSGFVKNFIGSVFGKKRESVSGPNMANFNRDEIGWNGIAQKTLVEVIPSYLASIEAAVKQTNERYYNMDTGMFMSKGDIKKDYAERLSNSMKRDFLSVDEILNKTSEKSGMTDAQLRSIKNLINKSVKSQTFDSSKPDKYVINKIISELNKMGVDKSDIAEIATELSIGIKSARLNASKFVNDTNKNTAYSQIFNNKSRKVSSMISDFDIFNDNLRYIKDDGSRMTDEEIESYNKMKDTKDETNKFFKKIKSKFSLKGKGNLDSKIAGGIDSVSYKIIEFLNKYDEDNLFDIDDHDISKTNKKKKSSKKNGKSAKNANLNPIYWNDRAQKTLIDVIPKHLVGIEKAVNKLAFGTDTPASTKIPKKSKKKKVATSKATGPVIRSGIYRMSNIDKEISRLEINNFDAAMDMSSSEIDAQSATFDNIVEQEERQLPAVIGNEETALATVMAEDSRSLKTLVLGLNKNFLQPMVGKLFGKDGFFRNLLSDDSLKKINKKLFDEENGVFNGVTKYMKDSMDYIKYTFNGKAYTDRSGEFHEEKKDSVFDHLSNGYDSVYKNVMKYLFGDDYEDNDTFNKYFKWMDFKGKRDKKRENKLKEAELENKEVDDNTKAIEDNTEAIRGFHNLLLSASQNKVKSKLNYNTDKAVALPGEVGGEVKYELVESARHGGEIIVDAAENTALAILGDYSDENKVESENKKITKGFFDDFKKHVPKILAGGVAGLAAGALLGAKGTGLIGSLFLPGGPIGGAILGMGLTFLSRSEAVKEFIFGKEEDGKKVNGLISQKTQDFFKKNMPIIAGGAALGIFKNIVFGSHGGLLGSLLGGPIAGAAISIGFGLMKSNDTIREILFGKKDSEKKRNGIISSGFKKVKGFFKGGLAGAGIGAVTSATIGQMGAIGASLTVGGPIGGAITGLALGIASQTNKFKELLFGTEEFDENGNSLGRRKDGLLNKIRNMLVLNVFEPIKNKITEKAIDFAYWAKDKIEYPFRLAFGPILDSLNSIKDHITNSIHDIFTNVGEKITVFFKEGIRKVLSPFGKALNLIGKTSAKLISGAVKASLLPVTAPLKALQFLTAPKRRKEAIKEKLRLFGPSGIRATYGDLRQQWADEDAVDDRDYGRGLIGRANRFITRGIEKGKSIKERYKTGLESYEDNMKLVGKNKLDWMSAKRDQKENRRNWKNWKKNVKISGKADSYRRALAAEFDYADGDPSEDRLNHIRNKFAKLGIKRDWIQTADDLNMLLYNKGEWEEKYLSKDKNSSDYISKHGMPVQDSPKTTKFQDVMTKYVDEINKNVAKIVLSKELDGMDNLKYKDILKIDKRLRSNGLTWDDVGIDPSTKINLNDIKASDWDDFLKQKFSSGDITDVNKDSYSYFFKKQLERDSAKIDVDGEFAEGIKSKKRFSRFRRKGLLSEGDMDAIREEVEANGYDSRPLVSHQQFVDYLNGDLRLKKKKKSKINRTSKNIERVEGEILTDEESKEVDKRFGIAKIIDAVEDVETMMKNQMINNGASMESVQKSTGDKGTIDAGIAESIKDNKEKLSSKMERLAREQKESEEAKALNKENLSEQISEDVKDSVSDEAKKGKGTVVDSVKGFFSGIFGKVGSVLSSPKFWKAAGIVSLIGSIYGDSISNMISPISNWISTNGPIIVNKAMEFIGDAIPKVSEYATSFIMNNMVPIITNSAKILWTGVKTIGKMALNGISESLFHKTLFDDVSDGKSGDHIAETKTFDSKQEAEKIAKDMSANVYTDKNGKSQILDSSKYIDEDTGEVKSVSTGMASKLLRGASSLILNPRAAVKGIKGAGIGARLAGKLGWWGLKHVPIVGKVFKGLEAGAKGIKASGSWIAEKVSGKIVSRKASRAAKKASLDAASKVIAKNGESAITKITKKSGAKIGKEVVEKESKNTCKKFLKKLGGLSKFSDKFTKWLPKNKFTSWLKFFIENLGKKLLSSNSKILAKVGKFITGKTALAVGKASSAGLTAGISEIIFVGIGAISGAIDAAELFGVDSDDVTAGMRAVSALIQAFLNSSIGIWFDIALTVYGMVTGDNPQQWLAHTLYKFIASKEDGDELDKNLTKMQLETDKYNSINKTNLTTKEYNELKNGKSWWQFWKDDFDDSKYKVSQQEVDAAYARKKNGSSTSANLNTNVNLNTANVSSEQIANYQGEDLISYGSGKSRTRSVGYGVKRQDDPRWSNYKLGKFPDGTDSTMATGGCGPTAMSMVAEAYGKNVSPIAVAKYAQANGYIKDGGATSGLFTEGASRMGLHAHALNADGVKYSLRAGNPVLVSGKGSTSSSPYTEAGHIVMASGVDKNGNAIVNDPMRGRTTVSMSKLTRGMTNGWTYSDGKYGIGTTHVGISYGESNDVYKYTKQLESFRNDSTKNYQDPDKYKPSFRWQWNSSEGTFYLEKLSSTNSWERCIDGNTPITSKGNNDMLEKTLKFAPDLIPYYLYWDHKHRNDPKANYNRWTIGRNDKTPFYQMALAVSQEILKNANGHNDYKWDRDSLLSDNSSYTLERYGDPVNDFHGPVKAIDKSDIAYATLVYQPELFEYWASSRNGVKPRFSQFSEYNNIINNKDKAINIKQVNDKSTRAEGAVVSNPAVASSYKGLTIASLKSMASANPTLLTNPKYRLFASLYNYYVKQKPNAGYVVKDSDVISQSTAKYFEEIIAMQSKYPRGETKGYYEKNGLPFFPLNDTRWNSLSWKNGLFKHTGSDLASIAMGISGFSNSLLPPNYIYSKWLTKYPEFGNSMTGLNMDAFIADGTGYNTIKSAMNGDIKSKITRIDPTVTSIMSHINGNDPTPVIIRGYKYKGSPFGDGDGKDITEADTTSRNLGTIIVTAGKGTSPNGAFIVNNPSAKFNSNDIFSAVSLSEKTLVGKGKFKPITSAYSIGLAGGGGINRAISIANKANIPEADYVDPSKQSGLGKISAIFKNIASIGSHLITSYIDGTKYRSIKDVNEMDDSRYIAQNSNTENNTVNGIGPLGYGGGRKSFNIGFGKKKKSKKKAKPVSGMVGTLGKINSFDDMMNAFDLIQYSNQAEMTGGNYEDAWNTHLAELKGTSGSSDGTASSVTSIDGGNTSSGGNGTSGTFSNNGSGSAKVAKSIYDFFVSNGYTKEAAAGIVGNVQQESSFNPKSGTGQYKGLFQLSEYDRFANCIKWCNKNGYDPWSIEGQTRFALQEMSDKHTRTAQFKMYVGINKSDYKNITDPKEAAHAWVAGYEGAIESGSGLSAKWQQDEKRQKYAKSWYDKFTKEVVKGIGRTRALGYGGSWLSIVKSVKAAIASKKPGYSKTNYINITIDGVTKSVRTDCSGFVSACCQFYGVKMGTITSFTFTSRTNKALSDAGFTSGKWPGWENLKSGDIIAKSGHVEIFAYNKDGKHYVYNCGGHTSVNNPNETLTGHSKGYTTVWRPAEAGSINDSSLNITDNSNNTIGTTNASINVGTNRFGTIFDSVKGPGSFFERTLGGTVSSDYGPRNSMLGSEFHRGIDISADLGSNVFSPIDGTVVSTGNDVAGYGNYAVVQDRNGNNHLFAHMNNPVGYGVGTFIKKNDVIGQVGSTGKSTGSHLHYEIRRNGNKYSTINPNTYNYDGYGKNLNINSQNLEGYGSGNKDIDSKDMSNKLDVALNTDNIETKMDSLISVVKQWVDQDSANAKRKGDINTTNNTVVNYGNGKKTVKHTVSKPTKVDDTETKVLQTIHDQIALK